MSHDEALFDLPDQFMPERFLTSQYGTKDGVDASHWRPNMIFGSGRVSAMPHPNGGLVLRLIISQRVCPGIAVANTTIVSFISELSARY